MTDAGFWEIERGLWLGGAEAFRRWVAAECVMVFPAPAGILVGPVIFERLASAPRWEQVDLDGRVIRRLGDAAVVLAYQAEAARSDGVPYRALCSSSYVREAGDWWLVQHQQTSA